MEKSANKSRTSSRCREWERQRRNKFNEAISKLGELVREINQPEENVENVQFPKIEIVQNAVLCLRKCENEITQLKAEVLALQVKLDVITNHKNNNMKDASSQVSLSFTKSNKYMKLVMTQKTKRNLFKEKPIPTTNIKQMLPPKILPKIVNKTPPENTIVVLPAAPYVFPQRPLLFPTMPPAIVLVDPNLQNIKKLSYPIINRNAGEVTKTTMVNILPISAYSRPLSATKNKNNNVKSKKSSAKKSTKSIKTADKNTDSIEKNVSEDKTLINSSSTDTKCSEDKLNDKVAKPIEQHTPDNNTLEKIVTKDHNDSNDNNMGLNKVLTNVKDINGPTSVVEKNAPSKEKSILPKTCNNDSADKKSMSVVTDKEKITKITNVDKTEKPKDKITPTPSAERDKENKLPNLLETSLCDTVVDGGNARLELAEEFLAASPTAAFLMSFPLVSGNRADSPAEDVQNSIQSNSKDNAKRNEVPTQSSYFEKSAQIPETKQKPNSKLHTQLNIPLKHNESQKFPQSSSIPKQADMKTTENPFLNLPMSSLITTSCTLSDTSFGLDLDCNISKSMQNPSTSYSGNSNLFYKSDSFNSVKNTIYGTNPISSAHDFNNLGLYPCAMEKYASKSKCDYPNVEDNLMKINSSRLTYDIDLGWSHKGFDFVNCTTSSNNFNKDNILSTQVSAPYASSYNPFNPEFHVPLVTNSSKKENAANKTNTSFADTITSLYSQPTNLWSDDVPFYNNTNTVSKSIPSKQQNYLNIDALNSNHPKPTIKHFDVTSKQVQETVAVNALKPTNVSTEQQAPEKFLKKSPTKMHINWMTSETRNMESHCNPLPVELKEIHKSSYGNVNTLSKKQDNNESYFPISVHNFATQPPQDDFQIWPPTRPAGPTEITIEPPPINLPTLVGDLALGPHDKKKNIDISNRAQTHDLQNCGNFLSVTQLMNRSSDNVTSKYQVPCPDVLKTVPTTKQLSTYFSNDVNRKSMPSRIDTQVPQSCYGFPEAKSLASYESMIPFSHTKSKLNKNEKSSKTQKNSYSAESLIRGVSGTQKTHENNHVKFAMSSQKYNDFNASQDSSVAQVSHFPAILDYSDNSYASQQLSGTTLYNGTTNTISNSFYSNFMPGSSNLMSSNYANGPFSGEYIDYSNQTECNYTNQKYEELKMRNNSALTVFPHEKVPTNYKSTRSRESASKHKLECSKKDSTKKYQSKRAKLNNDVEEWNDPVHNMWQNKLPSKRSSNLVPDEISFPNYVSNQMPTQYQPEIFNSHLVPPNMQGHNVDRSLFPVTSRANFNLSTIFPEITMKVQ